MVETPRAEHAAALKGLKVAVLRSRLADSGAETKGKKGELVARLLELERGDCLSSSAETSSAY